LPAVSIANAERGRQAAHEETGRDQRGQETPSSAHALDFGRRGGFRYLEPGSRVVRRAFIAVFLLGALAAPAGAATPTVQLMPGVTYSRTVQFTPHGIAVMHVVTAPRPGGLWDLEPVLSDGAIVGRDRVTVMERQASSTATVAGVNGDYFNSGDGRPQGILMQSGVLESRPYEERSSLGVGRDGSLSVDQVTFAGVWQGKGQRQVLNGLNEPAPPNGVSLFTPAWGATTPATPGALNVVSSTSRSNPTASASSASRKRFQ